jgi:hypothetical protein
VAARITGVGETTLRRRRTDWMRAGVFSRVVTEALEAYDKVVGLDLAELAIDTSEHKAPMGGGGTAPAYRDRHKMGWKWSLATEGAGIPVAWVVDAANRHDTKLLDETFDALDARGYELEVQMVHLDRGYDYFVTRDDLAEAGLEAQIPRRRRHKRNRVDKRRVRAPRGERWRVERANSWLSNFGQLRRNTDRKAVHREAAIDLAVALILTTKLVKWHRRYGAVVAG